MGVTNNLSDKILVYLPLDLSFQTNADSSLT